MEQITTGRGSFARDLRPHYVYQFFDKQGRALYVGMTASPGGRMASHASKPWWSKVDHFSATVYPCRGDALQVEADLIETLDPLHNFYHAEASVGSRSGRGHGGVAFRKSDVAEG